MKKNVAYHTKKMTTIKLTPCVRNAVLAQSKKIDGCIRNDKGSVQHFLDYVILKELKLRGIDLVGLHPEYYQ